MKKLVLAVLGLGVVGCAPSSNAPFHMYDSPLLQSGLHPSVPKARNFDPLGAGDFQTSDTYQLAQAEPATPRSEPKVELTPKPKPTDLAEAPKKKLPTLAIGSRPDPQTTGKAASDWNHRPEHSAAYAAKVLEVNGHQVEPAAASSVSKLYKHCKESGKISHDSAHIGDLVFFHNVSDINADGRNNDWYTFVGVIESKTSDVYTIQGVLGGNLSKHTMRLAKDEPTDASSRLREPSASDPPFTQYYTSELFAGFCGLLGDKPDLILVDEWSP